MHPSVVRVLRDTFIEATMRPVGRPYHPSVQQRGSLLIGAGSLVLLVGAVLLSAYFVHVQDAAARAAEDSRPPPAAIPERVSKVTKPAATAPAPAATPAEPPVKATGMLAKSVELEFDGKRLSRTWAELGVALDDSGTPVGDRERAQAALLEVKSHLDRAPLNARMDLEARKVHREQAGYGIEMFAAMSAIETAARSRAAHVALEGAPIPASFGVAELGIEDVSVVLGHYETKFAIAEKSRNDNLKLLASHMDGRVLQPGQEMSFNAISGDRTEKEGYKVAHVITAGEMVDGMAGGACQISTTLHGAAFFAGLDITATTPHSRPSTYVPLGFDSTVVYPSVDLKIKNPYDFPVAIRYRVARGEAEVEITRW